MHFDRLLTVPSWRWILMSDNTAVLSHLHEELGSFSTVSANSSQLTQTKTAPEGAAALLVVLLQTNAVKNIKLISSIVLLTLFSL